MKRNKDMMTIKRKFILPLLTLTLLFGACNDLVEEPIGNLAPEGFFKSVTDVHTAINGGYTAIASEEFWGRKLTLSLLLRGDMCEIGDPTTRAERIQVDEFQMDAASPMVDPMWGRGYEAISAINLGIRGGSLLEGVPQEEVNEAIATGYFLRAFIFYHFVRIYGEVPYIDYIFESAEEAYAVDENSIDDIYGRIIDDLEFAKTWLPDVPINRSRPGKGTAAAYLASVYLTQENWPKAYEEAKFVIDNSDAFGYGLARDYQGLFDATLVENAENEQELLFYVDFKGLDESSLSGFGNLTRDYLPSVTGPRGDERHSQGEGWSVAVPSLAVYNTWNANDYRRAVSFDTVTMMGDSLAPYTEWGNASRGVSRPHIAKYYRSFGQAGLNGRDSDNNYGTMRFAEVLLIAAEALNEINTGPTAEAISYINLVRERARRELDADASNDSMIPADVTTGLSYDQFLTTVLEERRLELAFEFKRWYDLKRRELAVEAFSPGGLEPDKTFDPTKDYLFPKPQSELALLENLDQNDGYGN